MEKDKRLTLLAAYLKELRRYDMTQSELADETCISLSSIKRYEQYANMPLKRLLELADFYEIRPSELLEIID